MTAMLSAVPTGSPMLRILRRRRLAALSVPAVMLLYLGYVFLAFDLPGLAQRARLDNAAILMSDFWSHKVHVTRDNRSGAVVTAVEGEAKGRYPEGTHPDWVTVDGATTTIDLGAGHVVTYDDSGAR